MPNVATAFAHPMATADQNCFPALALYFFYELPASKDHKLHVGAEFWHLFHAPINNQPLAVEKAASSQ